MRRWTVSMSVALLFAFACDGKQGSQLNCIALLDFSASVSDEAFSTYCAVLRDGVLKHLTRRDRLLARPIDYSSEQRSEVLFEVDLSRENFSSKLDGFAKKQEKERARLQAYLDEKSKSFVENITYAKQQRRPFALYTDIVGALLATRIDLIHQPGVNNLIVVFSDMIQESKDINLAEFRQPNQGRQAALIKHLEDRKLIADLKGVRIFVLGPGESVETSGESYRAVRSFWIEFFGKAGAVFDEADYGYRNQERLGRLIYIMQGSPKSAVR